MQPVAVVALAVASSALTSVWHLLVVPAIDRARARAAARRDCAHVWGDPFEVAPPPFGHGQRFYIRSCERCGSQLHTDAAGTPYVPRNEREK